MPARHYNSKYILGIFCYFHDSSACLLHDGKIVAMAEEERFNRKKHCSDFPENAIAYCLEVARIDMSQIDSVLYGFLPWRCQIRHENNGDSDKVQKAKIKDFKSKHIYPWLASAQDVIDSVYEI